MAQAPGQDTRGAAPAVPPGGWSAHLPTILLASCMFFTGAAGLVSEYVLSTVSTYILGNSIEQFSIIIALMLLMMGVAGYLQRYLSDRQLLDKFILVECSLALLAGFAPPVPIRSRGHCPQR